MSISAHLFFSLFFTMEMVFILNMQVDVGVVLFSFVGAMIPKIDHTTGPVGAMCYPLSSWIQRRFGRGTLTHSMLFITLVGLGTFWVGPLFGGRYHFCIVWSLLASIMCAELTWDGVEFFWPVQRSCVAWLDKRYRIRPGSVQERVFTAAMALLCLVLLPVYSWGIETTLYRITSSLQPGFEYARVYFLDNRLHAEIDGMWTTRLTRVEPEREYDPWLKPIPEAKAASLDAAPPKKEFEIVSIGAGEMYLRDLDDHQTVYRLSIMESAMLVLHIRIKIVENVRRVSVTKTYTNEVPDLAFLTPFNLDDVLVNGELTIAPDEDLPEAIASSRKTSEAHPVLLYEPKPEYGTLVISRCVGSQFRDVVGSRAVYIYAGHLDFLITQRTGHKGAAGFLNYRFYES